MDLREQETAAAVQDLEVRQLELEAQRRRLEQVTDLSHSPRRPLRSIGNLEQHLATKKDQAISCNSYRSLVFIPSLSTC